MKTKIVALCALALVVLPTLSALPATALADSNLTVGQTATLTMTDAGFSPASVALVPGGNLTVVNGGSVVHKAQAAAIGTRLDTGDLAPGQSAVIAMPSAGAYTFQSATDSMTGNTPFDQSASATVTVSSAAVGSAVNLPGQFSGPLVVMTDAGLQQQEIDVQAGQTVTWFNLGNKAHSVVGSTGTAGFDSGAISDGGSFSVTFSQAGSYGYSSSIDGPTAAFNGKVVVS
jgi:plastocyanin